MSELILTCRTCGSEFMLPEGTPMRACPSCGTEHSRPRASGSALDALRRAHQQRAACDFMNAAHSYQHVLIDHPNEHEALWGLVLCRYGIEYVTDERTGQRLPTMHFMQRRPITQDGDFALACQSAPEGVCAQYQRDADYILRIQQSVWAARTSCPACDVFLCYKASDASSADGKARELGYARELYFHLIADGYRVFFAHESLQSLSGANYEAQIFHALQSAKVLLLVCSDPAHLTTPWVQSEWSRFLERADQDDSLRLIPLLYDGVAPESLPAPILTRRLEGLRMGELTSYNRLCRSVEAVLRPAPAVRPAAYVQPGAQPVLYTPPVPRPHPMPAAQPARRPQPQPAAHPAPHEPPTPVRKPVQSQATASDVPSSSDTTSRRPWRTLVALGIAVISLIACVVVAKQFVFVPLPKANPLQLETPATQAAAAPVALPERTPTPDASTPTHTIDWDTLWNTTSTETPTGTPGPVEARVFEFTIDITSTVPRSAMFTITSNTSVKGVRIVTEHGSILPTNEIGETILTADRLLYLFELPRLDDYTSILSDWEGEYLGNVRLQINDGSRWLDTEWTVQIPPAPTPAPIATKLHTSTPKATVNITPTPTLKLTPTPTPTLKPTPTVPASVLPTVTTSSEPTAKPTPTPTAKLVAAASRSASPSLVANQKIYVDTRRVDTYQRDEKSIINMPAGDEYLTLPFGVTTFRGNAFRMNAAVGYVKVPTAMETAWSVEGGKLEIKAGMRYGFGVYSQPAIIKWPREIRQLMVLNESYREKGSLKEVIIAGQDGKVYFLDLTDGSATRAPINLGYPLRSTPSVHTLGYPVLTFGQFSNKLPDRLSKNMGLYYYSLVDNSQLRLLNTMDDRAYYQVGTMDTSALIDRNSNTLITIGSNGILYTEKMDLYLAVGTLDNAFTFKGVTDQAALVSYTKNQKSSQAAVESSLAMYGSYAFYADMGGILRCVDTTSMTTVWAVNTGDAVRASIALDLDETTNTLWLYTANTITNRAADGDVTIRRFNAMTGEEDWTLPVNSVRKYKGQKDATGKEITAGAVASPIIGQHQLSDLVYFTLSSVSAEGFASLTGDTSAMQQPSVLVAMDKATGDVIWAHAMDAYSYSSPVAVYSEAGQGWIIQCCSNGTIYLMDGLTGKVVNTLQVTGTIEGSPAVYGDMMVFGTTGKNTSYIYAIRIR